MSYRKFDDPRTKAVAMLIAELYAGPSRAVFHPVELTYGGKTATLKGFDAEDIIDKAVTLGIPEVSLLAADAADEAMLKQVREALTKMTYKSTHYPYPQRKLMQHHLEAVMDTVGPFIVNILKNPNGMEANRPSPLPIQGCTIEGCKTVKEVRDSLGLEANHDGVETDKS